MWPSGRVSVVSASRFNRTSHTLMGVKVLAGPFEPSMAPAMIRAVPALSGRETVGMSALRID
ncbi:hypothetical protein D3C75_1357750 [compost metagenome]